MPWAPEPVMLMAGLSKPMTRASIVALQRRDAVICSSLEMTSPPFIASNCLAKVVRGLLRASSKSSRFTLYASFTNSISSKETVFT